MVASVRDTGALCDVVGKVNVTIHDAIVSGFPKMLSRVHGNRLSRHWLYPVVNGAMPLLDGSSRAAPTISEIVAIPAPAYTSLVMLFPASIASRMA